MRRLQIANFFAEVLLHPSSSSAITLVPHHIYDPSTFDNLRQLSTISGREGYSGEHRRALTTCGASFAASCPLLRWRLLVDPRA